MSWTSRLFVFLCFFLAGAYMTHQAVSRPALNWDLIGYVAAVKQRSEPDLTKMHAATYQAVRSSVSAQDYDRLTTGPFRESIANSPTLLGEQLPFYQIRPIYLSLLALMEDCGVNLVKATYLVPAACTLATLLLMAGWALSVLPATIALSLVPAAWLLGMAEIARLSTPDGLAMLGLITSAFALSTQRWRVLFILLPLLVAIRTDLLLWAAPLGIVACALAPKSRKAWALLAVVATLVTYWFINRHYQNPGWSVIFKFTLISNLQPPSSLTTPLQWSEYALVATREIKALLLNKAVLFHAVVVLISAHVARKDIRARGFQAWAMRPENLLQIVCISFIGTHFLAFPVAWERFFCAPQLASFMCLLIALNRSAEARSTA